MPPSHVATAHPQFLTRAMDLPAPALTPRPAGPPTGLPPSARPPDSPEEAAAEFEKVLVRRFVRTMTEKMFDTTLSGSDGPGWMNSQRDHQRDVLTDVLADHIVEADTLGIRDMLLEDWGAPPEAPARTAHGAAPAPADAPAVRSSPFYLSRSSTRR